MHLSAKQDGQFGVVCVPQKEIKWFGNSMKRYEDGRLLMNYELLLKHLTGALQLWQQIQLPD